MGQIFTISKKNYHFRIELPHLPGPSIVVSICLFEHYVFITARKRSLGQGNIFRSVCQEFCSQRRVSAPGGCLLLGGAWSGGVCSREAVCLFLGGGAWWRPPWMATAAGGMHPTGMHSCLIYFITIHKQSCGKVMFLHLSMILGRHPPCRQPPGQTPLHPQEDTHPWKDTPG